MQRCDSCGRSTRALYDQGNNVGYCLSCHERASAIRFQAMNHAVAEMNFLRNQIEDTFGVPRTEGIRLPQPTYYLGNTNNSVNVTDSIVGTINTGVVESLNNSLSNMAINDGLTAKQLETLVTTIGANKELADDIKEGMLESVTFLADQVQAPATNRNKSMIKAAVSNLKTSLATSSDLVTLIPIVLEIGHKIL